MRRALGVLALLVVCAEARAQDFDSPQPGARFETAAVLLEDGLPPAVARWTAEGSSVGRHAIAELSTRAVAVGGAWQVLRVAAGLSQTGDPQLGWTAVGAGLGVAGANAGFGVRAAARRDRWWLAEATPLGSGLGAEAGLGAWIRPTSRIDVWASAPHIWVRGSAPPLERGLRTGVRMRWSEISAWVEQEVRAPGAAPAVAHRAGIELAAGATRLWASVLDAPLRATVGVATALSWLGVAAEAESHPVLGETVRLAVTLHSSPAPTR
jgi:hypothetical protein